MPLDFVENRGQWEVRAKFVARRGSLAADFDDNAIRLHLGSLQSALGFTFEGASQDATLVGEGERSGHYNFIIGDDPTKWRSQVASYGSLLYRGLYGGVDLRVSEDGDQLRYDLLLAPGADVARIVVRADGADRPSIADDGSLVLQTASGSLRQSRPLTWEELPDGATRRLESRFRIIDAQRYGFEVLGHDPLLALVIDPGLDWATFLGGSGDETVEGLAIVTDGSGDIVLAGQTWSPDFPRTGGNVGPTGMTPYVARLNASGTALVYATFFGGSFNHSVKHVALDASNRPVVVGDTNSLDFPTTPGAFDRTPPDGFHGDYDAYVIKFNATGSGLVFSTYLGGSPGSGLDQAWRVGHDPAGSVIVAGITTSADFPTTPGAFDRTLNGRDIFIARLDPTGSQLTYSTFLGGEAGEDVFGMVVDGQGFVTLTGQTFSTTFPVTPDAFDPTYNGSGDAFVARLKLDGAGAADLKYATFLGGSQSIEAGNGIAFDPNNQETVTVSGFTRSGDFPTTLGALLRTHFAPVDSRMAFVARFRFPAAAPGSLVWSTLYGAPGNQSADDVVVDSTGAAIIVGGTAANNPPTTERAFDRIPGAGYGVGFPEGKADGYVARISADGGSVLYCTLLGGSYGDTVSHVAYAGGTSVVVAGLTSSPDFPVTAGAFDTIYASDGRPSGNATLGSLAADVFVARLTLAAPATGDITPPPAPDLLSPPVGATFDYPGRNLALDWSDVADPSGVAAYHLQFSPNAGFVNDFNAELNGWFEPWLPTSVAVFTAGHSGTFFWRVQALDRAGNLGPWSAVRSLTVASSTPAAPNPLSPPDAGQFAPGTVAFAWAAAAGAKTYELEVDTTSTFTGSGKIFVSGITQLQQTLSLTAETTYWWHVRGASEVTVGPWSTVRSFRIKGGSPPAPPPPPSTSPPPGPATALAGLTLGADVVFGAGTVSGTVTLNGAAPAGGATVALASNYPSRSAVPASVTVPAGSTSATFSVTTAASTQFAQVMISGQYGGVTQGGVLQAYASDPVVDLDNFTVSTTTLLGGDTVQGTVAILFTFTAGSGGALVTLGSTNPALASVPASVTIPAGTNSASFVITTQPVTTATTVTILASRSRTIGVALELLPPGALSSLSLNPTTVSGGQSSQGTVTLAGPAPAGGVVVALSSSNTAVATVPASVGVPAGAASATFTVSTNPVFGSGTWSTVTASAGGISRSAILNVNPGAPPPAMATLSSVAVSPASVTGGASSTGTVTLTAAAPAGGAAVALSSSNTAAATVPASVTVAAGATTATFTVSTASVSASTPVTITGAFGGATRTATLTVTPPPPPPPAASLSAVSVSPTSVAGGASAQGTVTLTSAAPAGGLAVALSSNNAAAAVPASVTVPANATSATFTVPTTSVAASTVATITASAGGVTRTAALTVTPPPPPAQTATLTVTATGRDGETVSSSPAGISVAVGSTGSASFATGTAITLSVSNGRDAIWSGACSSGGNKAKSCTFTLTAAATVSANVQ